MLKYNKEQYLDLNGCYLWVYLLGYYSDKSTFNQVLININLLHWGGLSEKYVYNRFGGKIKTTHLQTSLLLINIHIIGSTLPL